MALALSTPITKSPFPAKPTPAAKPPPAPKPPAKPAVKPTPLTKPITAPIVATSHPALEPKPVGPKVTTPAHGGASSRLPKKTTGVEPHAKLPPVPAPASSPIGSAVAGSQVALPKKVVAAQKREMAQGNTGVKVVKSIVSDVPKEIAGKGVLVTAGRKAVGTVAGAAGSAAQDIVGSAAKSSGVGSPSLRRAQQTAVKTDIPKELKGKGVLEQGLFAVGATARGALSAGQPDSFIGKQMQVAGLGGPAIGKYVATTAEHFGSGLANLPATIIPAAVDTGTAAVQAFEGNSKPLTSQLQAVAQGFTPKGFEANPLNTLLMVSGGLSAIGRAGVAVTDAAGLTRSAGWVDRPPTHLVGNLYEQPLPGTRDPKNLLIRKAYEKRPLAKAVQTVRTGMSDTKAPMPRTLAQVLEPHDGGAAPPFRDRGVPFGIPHKVRQAAHREAAAAESVRRAGRATVTRVMHDAIKAPRTVKAVVGLAKKAVLDPRVDPLAPMIHGRDAVSLIGQHGWTRPSQVESGIQMRLASLDPAYRAEFAAEHPGTPLPDLMAPESNAVAAEMRQHHIEQLHTLLHNRGLLDNPQELQTAIDTARSLKSYQDANHTPGLRARALLGEDTEGARWSVIANEAGYSRDLVASRAMEAHQAYQTAVKDAAKAKEDVVAAVNAGNHDAIKEAGLTLQAKERIAEALKVDEPTGGKVEAWVHRQTGKAVGLDEIKAWARDNGRAEPFFHSHQAISDAGARYIKSSEFPLAESHFRTGEAWRRGLVDTSYGSLVNHFLRERGKIDANDPVLGHLKRVAVFDKNPVTGENTGYFGSPREAQAAIHEPGVKAQNPHGLRLIPVRVGQQFTRQMQLQGIKSQLTPIPPIDEVFGPSGEAMSREPFTEMTRGQDPGQWVLAPADYVNQLKEFEKGVGGVSRVVRGVTTQWRRRALGMSPRRFLGLPIETWGARGAPAGVIPHLSARPFRALRDIVTRPEYNTPEFKAMWGQTGSEFLGQMEAKASGAAGLNTQALTERVFEGSRSAGGVMRLPVVGHAIKAWTHGTDAMMRAQRYSSDHPFRQALVGKQISREFRRLTGVHVWQAMDLQGKAFQQYVENMMHEGTGPTNHIDAFARMVDRWGGRWGKLSPTGQSAMPFAPFGLWFVNSLKFVYGTMPADHPIITGLLAAADTGTQEQRQGQGLLGPILSSWNPFEVTNSQENSLPFGAQRWMSQYYSPYDIASDPVQRAISMVVPQISGPFFQAYGDTFYGSKMTMPGLARGADIPQEARMGVVLNSFLDGFGPVQQIQTIIQGGRSQYGTSTIWNPEPYADTSPSTGKVLEKLFGPLKVERTRLASGNQSAGSSSAGGIGSGGIGSGGIGSGGIGSP